MARCLFAFVAVLSTLLATAAPRLAVVPLGESVEPLADALVASLSKDAAVELVERSQLAEIVRENGLYGTPRGFAGADALVFLDPLAAGTNGTSVATRVVSVARGAAMGWWTEVVEPGDVTEWARNAASRMTALVGKIAQPDEALARISFVGFRSTASTPDVAADEALLNALLLARLGAEPDLLVMERRRLLDASFEKMLTDDDRAFWNGAHLIEGTINRDGITEGRVTLHVRMARVGTAPAEETTLSGSPTNMAVLADAFVRGIRLALSRPTSTRYWDPATEALRFRVEARSAIRFQRWDDARSAADTSYALGLRDRAGLLDRLLAYAGSTGEASLDLYRSWYTPRNDAGVLTQYGSVPDTETVSHALEAARLMQELCGLPKGGLADGESRRAVLSTLDDLGRLLLKFYFAAESRAEVATELGELRQVLRETTDRLLASVEMRSHCFMAEPIAVTFVNEVTDAEKDTVAVFERIRRYGPMFFETPEKGVALHKRLMISPRYGSPDPRLRAWALNEKDPLDLGILEWLPPVFGWTWQARQRCEPVWAAFEADFERVVSAYRRLGSIHEVPTDARYAAAMETLIQHFQTNRLEDVTIAPQMVRAFDATWNLERTIISDQVVAALETNQIVRLRAVLASIDSASTRAEAGVGFRTIPGRWARTLERFEHAAAAGEVPSLWFITRWLMADEEGPLTQAKAERWLAVLARLRDMASAAGDRRAVQFLRPGGRIALELMRLQTAEPPQSARTASSNRLAGLATPELPEATRRLRVFDLPTGLHLPKVSGTLALEPVPVAQLSLGVTVEQAVWRDGLFWLLGFRHRMQAELSLVSLDPATRRMEVFPVPSHLFSDAEAYPRFVEAGREHVLLVLKRTAVTLDRRTRQMTTVPLPIEPAKVFREGDRLFLWSGDTLLETTETLADFKVLASLRRRPALGPLDELPSLTDLRLCAAGSNNVAVVLGKRIFPLDGTGGEWPVAPGLKLDVAESPVGALLHEASFGWPNYDPMRGSGLATGPGVHRIWRLGANPPDRESVWTSESIPQEGRALIASQNISGRYFLFGDHRKVLPFGGCLVSVPEHGDRVQIAVMPPDAWHPLLFDTAIKRFLKVGFAQGPREILFYASEPMSGRSTNFLFLLRQEELETQLARARQTEPDQQAGSRALTDQILATYDINRNGRLDEAELSCLSTEPEAMNLAWTLCDDDRSGRLDLSELRHFDFDHNRAFDAAETAAFLNATAYLARVRFLHAVSAGQNSVPLTNQVWFFMERGPKWDRSRADLDRDGALSWPEFLAAEMEQQHRNLLAAAAAVTGQRFEDLAAQAPQERFFLEPGFLSHLLHLLPRRGDLLSEP